MVNEAQALAAAVRQVDVRGFERARTAIVDATRNHPSRDRIDHSIGVITEWLAKASRHGGGRAGGTVDGAVREITALVSTPTEDAPPPAPDWRKTAALSELAAVRRAVSASDQAGAYAAALRGRNVADLAARGGTAGVACWAVARERFGELLNQVRPGRPFGPVERVAADIEAALGGS